jgi:hypothetical protein
MIPCDLSFLQEKEDVGLSTLIRIDSKLSIRIKYSVVFNRLEIKPPDVHVNNNGGFEVFTAVRMLLLFFWVLAQVYTNVSEKHTVSIFRTEVARLGSGGIYIKLEEDNSEGAGQSGTRNERAKRESPSRQHVQP